MPPRCKAVLVGVWGRGDGDEGHYGVRLDLPVKSSRSDAAAHYVAPRAVSAPGCEVRIIANHLCRYNVLHAAR